jgi:hypothetical protein
MPCIAAFGEADMDSDKRPGHSSTALPLAGAIILMLVWGVYTAFTVYHIVALN